MRIRWKILLVLLAISMVPMMALRWKASGLFHALALDLSEQARDALVRQSTQALKRLVEDHARVIKQEAALIDMILRVRTAELERRLAGSAVPAERPIRGAKPPTGPPAGALKDQEPSRYCRLGEAGACEPLTVSRDEPLWRFPPGATAADREQTAARFEGMAAVYDAVDREFPDLFLWQVMVLENGTQAVYPGPAGVAVPDGRGAPWYRQVRERGGTVWSMPVIDPLTCRIVIPVAAPIHGLKGVFAGAAALMVPVSALLHENRHIRMLSRNVTSLLVRAVPRPPSGESGIMIIASEGAGGDRGREWRYLQGTRWLSSDVPAALAPVASDLMNRRSGISEVPYAGGPTIMAYSVIGAEGTALLLIVPKSDLIADAESMERYVQARFIEEMKTTKILFSGVLAAVFLISLVLSRYVTQNIHKLLEGSRRLATGDFSTRIDIRSRDEVGELGRAFNRMVPDLEERIRLKQGLEVASSVQKSLLPKRPPDLAGFDMAAASRYCDETGGDFHDFIPLNRGGALGIAVGDVSGHGISAALLMATARAFLKSRVGQPGDLAAVISDVNRLVCRDTDATGQFLTLFYMEIAPNAAAVDWVRAGHDPAVWYDPGTGIFAELKGKGAALGLDEGMTYTAGRRAGLSPGHIIAVGTDGIWEARNAAGEMFGRHRFRALIRSYADRTARGILEGILADLKAFRGSRSPSDDVTIVIIKKTEG